MIGKNQLKCPPFIALFTHTHVAIIQTVSLTATELIPSFIKHPSSHLYSVVKGKPFPSH